MTLIPPDRIRAAVDAPRIVRTFVPIQAERFGDVQFESSRTDATEAAESVDAFTRRRADSRLGQALVDVLALVADLVVPFGAGALVAPIGVDALVLADVLSCGAFVDVAARRSVWIEDVARGAGADETSRGVLTGVLARSAWRLSAFVDVRAVGSRSVDFETLNANATVRPHTVDAPSVRAQVRHGGAFVDVLPVHGDPAVHAQRLVLLGVLRRADLAVGPPGLAHGAAAACLGNPGFVAGPSGATTVDQLPETSADPAIHACLPIGPRFEPFQTIAPVTSLQIDTPPVRA